ncbi:MAG: hypothetical protein HOB51_01665 [Thaumarchaeota archaeon]|nr:hypothetical protein [Nitrososphaerota archaeon]
MELDPNDIEENIRTPIQLFNDGIKADATRLDYTNKLKKVLCEFMAKILVGDPQKVKNTKSNPTAPKTGRKRTFCDADYEERANELVSLGHKDPKKTESIMLLLVKQLKERTKLSKTHHDYVTPDYVSHILMPLQKLFDMNNVPFSWKRTRSTLPEEEKYQDLEGYTKDDVQRMCNYANIYDKVIILLWASSGIRPAASDFKWGHLHPVYHYKEKLYWEDGEITDDIQNNGHVVCAYIEIYAQSKKWNYYAFVTPECWNAIQVYKENWVRKFGVEPKHEDPFFVNTRSKTVQSLTLYAVRRKLERLLTSCGIRTTLPKGMKRYKKPAFYGFRYFFNKQNKKAYSKSGTLASLILKETMIGHTGLIPLDKNYFRENTEELIEEYLNAVPVLTISDEERAKLQVHELTLKNKEQHTKFNQLEARISELEGEKMQFSSKIEELSGVDDQITELEQRIAQLKLSQS